MPIRQALTWLAVLGCLSACGDEFDPYNQITKFRLLGLRAEPPSLREGETATLSALVTEEGASYSWSWCPLTAGAAAGYECTTTQQELQAAADEALGEGVVTIPPFELGADPEVTMTYSFPSALVAGICQIILMNDLPEGVPAPECEGGYDLQIRLVTEADGVEIIGVRDLRLLFEDEAESNANPVINAISAIDPDSGDEVELAADAPTPLRRETTYELRLDVPETASESYLAIPTGGDTPEARREDLTITWFYEAGELDKSRTGYIDGDVEFETLLKNEWTTPDTDELPDSATRLFLVIRDNRGGVGFLSRDIELVAP